VTYSIRVMQGIELELVRLKRIMWASVVVSAPSTLFIFLRTSGHIKEYLLASHRTTFFLVYFDILFYAILPVLGFSLFLFSNKALINFKKFKRHDVTLEKLKTLCNAILIFYIVLLLRIILFLIFSY